MPIEDIEKRLIKGNLRYRWKLTQEIETLGSEKKFPRYPILILTCMDPRIDVHRIFQLNPGDVFVLRNGGNQYTKEILRSILIALYLYDIRYIVILGHLDCGMTKINVSELSRKIPRFIYAGKSKAPLDYSSELNNLFKPFSDEIQNIRKQLEILQNLKRRIPDFEIIGMLYDVDTGWIFEMERFKEIINIEKLRENYKSIMDEKKIQFIDFVESIEDEIIDRDEGDQIKYDKESNDADLGLLPEIVPEGLINGTEKNHINEGIKGTVTNSLKRDNQNLNTQTIIPKIKIPKIRFKGVKIHIPKIYRKMLEIKNED
ncbi:MAG: carbonic anhydrase [Promethearchaeota archaeon]|jgi:carbonic anhydrase